MKMVFFSRSEPGLEKQLTPEEMEQQKLNAIQHSPQWQEHARLHKQAGWGVAKLHIAEEPILQNAANQELVQYVQSPKDTGSYGASLAQHSSSGGNHYLGANDPNRSGFWAGCNCGAEFKIESGNKGPEVKSYGVVGTDQKSTNYAVQSTQHKSYGASESSANYQ
ncbi:hypothetical protein HZA98_02740 [Candidatus Woesearchaeota archaeon]|nr:hypothetical protein [Candidatus Woesearchaeota archaeon]